MTMDRNAALRRLRETQWVAPDGSAECVAGYFADDDAEGIARLFYAVYGEGYPVDPTMVALLANESAPVVQTLFE